MTPGKDDEEVPDRGFSVGASDSAEEWEASRPSYELAGESDGDVGFSEALRDEAEPSGGVDPDMTRQFYKRYCAGPNRYVNWVEDKLPVALSAAQKRLLRAVAVNRRVLVIGANGPGKSYAAACLVEAFLHTNKPSTVLATSGTYGKLKRTLCRPVKNLQNHDDLAHPLPGTYKHSPPRIDMEDPEWFFEAARPKDAGELEGTHNDHLLAITEEADKEAVDEDVVESMDSCLTDENDRHLVIANPPRDESNVVSRLMDSDKWTTVRFATWDSRNVRVDIGEHPGPKIPGLLGLTEVRDKWEEWNNEEWPGLAAAKAATERLPEDEDGTYRRDDLDERWYRRRAGVIPPVGTGVHRPLEPELVESRYQPKVRAQREFPQSLGVDVARSGDDTVAVGPHGDVLVIHYEKKGTDHTQQEEDLAEHIRSWPPLSGIAVDAVGEGSGLADGLDGRFGNVTRFKNSEVAAEAMKYDRCWGESLALFADYLAQGGVIQDRELYEQAMAAAREVTWEEKELSKRGVNGAKVLSATPKGDVKETLGRSPDHLDAALMAIWVRDTDGRRPKISATW